MPIVNADATITEPPQTRRRINNIMHVTTVSTS
jgi:hypothetical protein